MAVAAVSTSAPLVRQAAAPALAIAFWRNALALPLLGGWVLARREERAGWRARTPSDRAWSRWAGVLLALHFAAWIPSLSYTSVASSVALVSAMPVWSALIAHRRGDHVVRETWVGICVALAGVLVLTGVDLSVSGRALFGDLLALAGGALAAAYVTVGADVRRTVSTGAYVTSCYAVAATVLLVVCLVARRDLVGYELTTWLYLAAMVVGPQLLGHTLVNRLLETISPTVVSVAILFEIVGATLIARLWFGETPPAGAWPAAVLIAAGVVAVVRAEGRAAVVLDPPG